MARAKPSLLMSTAMDQAAASLADSPVKSEMYQPLRYDSTSAERAADLQVQLIQRLMGELDQQRLMMRDMQSRLDRQEGALRVGQPAPILQNGGNVVIQEKKVGAKPTMYDGTTCFLDYWGQF